MYHRLIEEPSPCVEALVKEFGEGILSGGIVDRNVLRSIVFADETKRKRLNEISHAFVTEELNKCLSETETRGVPFAVIDAPLLLESGLDGICDMVVAVIADRAIRLQRIIKRDGITLEAAKERIDKQISDEELARRCDAVIRNESSIADLEKQCKDLLCLMGICNKDKE